MFNPDKEFARLVIDCLEKDGKSISALSKDLEERGIKMHRLILTGYLRALTDQGVLREKDIPPSKIYIPVRSAGENIYDSVGKACRSMTGDADDLILYMLHRLFKRPIFDSEMRACGVMRQIGSAASEHDVAECRKVLKRAGNIVPSERAAYPDKEFPDLYHAVLTEIVMDTRSSKHLVMGTKQTKLI